jgi:aspartate aminotransferase
MAADMRKNGEDVIFLSIGEPDFKTPQKIIDAAKEALDRGETHYAPSRGIMELREEIARKMREENGIDVGPKNVIVTIAKHGVFMASQSVVQHGEEVVLPDPGWVSYSAISIFSGAKRVDLRSKEEDGFIPREEDIKNAVGDKTKLFVINTPSNPTGVVYPKKTLKVIADLAEDYDFYVLSDEIYEKLIYRGKHVSIASLGNMHERTITLNGFSKAYAMTGWRMGWITAPDHLIEAINKLQQQTITCVPPFIQRAGIVALRECASCVEEMRKEFAKRRLAALGQIDEMHTLDAFKPSGAFYIFAKYLPEINSFSLAEQLLEDYKVAVTPGGAFGIAGEGYIRISYAASTERLLEGLRRIEKGLSSM